MSDKKLNDADIEKMRRVGVEQDDSDRSGTFTVIDNEIDRVNNRDDGVEILGLPAAMKKYEYVKDMLWSQVNPHKDEFTEKVYNFEAEKHPVGQFLRIKSGTKSKKPFQSCFFIKLDRFTQTVHNIIVIEDDVEFHIITGCAVAAYINEGMHLGITEIFIGKNSKLSYTMIHDWAPGMIVRPRTGIKVDENSHFISNYISLRSTKMTQMYPEARLVGKGASARFTSLIASPKGSTYDLGSRIYLSAPETSAEIVSRAISSGGNSIARGHLIAEAPQTKGHLECNGLFIVEGGVIDAVPQLTAKVQDTDLSHEAALGKIDEEKLEYLMARGFSREQATQMMIKGFLDVGILGLPPELEEEVHRNMELMEDEAL